MVGITQEVEMTTREEIDILSTIRISRMHIDRLHNNERRVEKLFGCSFDLVEMINGREIFQPVRGYSSRLMAFLDQRTQAGQRGIAWEMNLADWWSVWENSGKWSKRGRGRKGFCMARICDVGPYRKDNVYICTCAQNLRDYWSVRKEQNEYALSK